MLPKIRIRQTLISCLLIVLASHMHAAAQTRPEKAFTFDRHWSPHASASIIMSSAALINEAEDRIFRTHHTPYNFTGIMISAVLNMVLNSFLTTINHEVYGHGFRLRCLGIPCRYTIKHLGLSGGTTCYSFRTGVPSHDHQLMITMGGTEANNILAQQIIFKHFRDLTLESKTWLLFINAYLDLPLYILDSYYSKNERDQTSCDISHYITELNHKYRTAYMDFNTLVGGAYISLCNPILYVVLWALLTSKTPSAYTIPHVKLGAINYMPLIRMGLTPFGLMYYIENYLGYGNKTFWVSISGGQSPYHIRGYGGIQLKTTRLYAYRNYGLDVVGHLWYQPKLQLKTDEQIEDRNYWGGMIGIDNQLMLNKQLSLHSSIVYKSKGFVEGIRANRGCMVTAGLLLHY
ncbi:MAG: hypothetical protein ACX93T_00530 [Bacteroidota bacterium]